FALAIDLRPITAYAWRCDSFRPRGVSRPLPSAPLSHLRRGVRGKVARPVERSHAMLNLQGSRVRTDCDGTSRRDFLKVGTLGLTGLMWPALLRARAAAKAAGTPSRNTSVVWLWLGGGPTHIETFDPKMTAPAEFRSVVGAIPTNVPGIELGGLLPQM